MYTKVTVKIVLLEIYRETLLSHEQSDRVGTYLDHRIENDAVASDTVGPIIFWNFDPQV